LTTGTWSDRAIQLNNYLQRLGIAKDHLSAWRPSKPRRGRPRKMA
jgi:hypothetical protein